MINFKELIDKAKLQGYTEINASAKVAQDVTLFIISKIEYNKNITLKGGVLMRDLSKDTRRATKDLDIDLIRYSIDDIALEKLINRFDGIEDIEVSINGKIKELKQLDYKGKRVTITLKDAMGYTLQTKIDFGVHTDLSIEQVDYCIDIGTDDNGICILANSKEQMLTEKLCSLLRHRITTTRYKDIFDIYYLKDYVDTKLLTEIIDKIILKNDLLKEENLSDIYNSLHGIFSNKDFINLINDSKDNWLNISSKEATENILSFVKGLM